VVKKLIIIPAFNEEKSIGLVVAKAQAFSEDFDVIVINDCSVDNTENVLVENGTRHITLPVNMGIGGAMQTGYMYAKENGYDFAVQIDGDGQHDPAEVAKLLQTQKKTGADLVIGSRFLGEKSFRSSSLRRFGISVFAVATKMLIGQKISDATSGFRLANKNVIDLYSEYYPSDYPEPEVIVFLKNHGMKIAETPVKMNERQGGKSSITPLKSIYYMVKVIGSMIMQKMRG
jgi:glycosyltransferase involved in cell wall biosynthesis